MGTFVNPKLDVAPTLSQEGGRIPQSPEGLWVFGIWRAEGTSIRGGTLKLHKTTEVNEIKGPESGAHTRLSWSS